MLVKANNSTSAFRLDALRLDRVIVRSAPTGRFRGDKLQSPALFYPPELGKLSPRNRKGWAMGRCPFHASKSGKSFSVNLETGGFHCWGCDARGGDIIDFVRRRDGLTFKEACQQLGAWDEVGQPSPPLVMVPVRYLTFDYDIDGLHYRASVKDEPRNYASVVRRFCRESADQLTAVGLEQSESADCETYWTRMALGLDELREIGLL